MAKNLARFSNPILLSIFFACASYLTFKGLDQNVFWDDESLTALYSRNILKTGEVTGWDGKNIIGYRDGAGMDNRFIDVFSPRLQFYLTAASFKLFGESTFTARFFHSILGLFTLFILYKYASGFFPKERYWALLVPLYLGLSPSFYLYIRQCRYYAATILLTIASIYLYKKLYYLKWIGCILFAITLSALFAAHYVAFYALLISLFVHLIIFERKGLNKERLLCIITVLIPTLILTFIIFLPMDPLGYTPFPKYHGNWLQRKLLLTYWHIREVNLLEWYPAGLFIVASYLICAKKDHDHFILRHLLIAFTYIVCVALISQQPISTTTTADVRYIVGLLPIFAIIAVVSIKHITGGRLSIGIPVILFCCLTNLLTFKPFTHYGWQTNLFSYIKEIHNDYETGYEAAIDYIKDNATANDKIFVRPSYMTYPIMYYCPEFIYCSQLIRSQTHFSEDALKQLPDYIFMLGTIPDWVVVFGPHLTSLNNYFQELHQHGINYELKVLLPVFWEDRTRPELLEHSFGQIKDFDPQKEGISIFKRKTYR